MYLLRVRLKLYLKEADTIVTKCLRLNNDLHASRSKVIEELNKGTFSDHHQNDFRIIFTFILINLQDPLLLCLFQLYKQY